MWQIALIGLLVVPLAHAIPPPIVTGESRRGVYYEQGLFIGGEQGREMSLLSLTLMPARNKPVERLILKTGEADGQSLKGVMPFYQVSLRQNPSRVVIDLAQTQRTRIESKDLAKRIQRSQVIESADFTMDPEDLSTNLTLYLKHSIRLEVFRQSASGELILDMLLNEKAGGS
jgi:hypothetical protein